MIHQIVFIVNEGHQKKSVNILNRTKSFRLQVRCPLPSPKSKRLDQTGGANPLERSQALVVVTGIMAFSVWDGVRVFFINTHEKYCQHPRQNDIACLGNSIFSANYDGAAFPQPCSKILINTLTRTLAFSLICLII